MRAVVQRVKKSSVTVDDKITGKIGQGLMVLIGVEDGDSEKDADYIADKVCGLRIFEDEQGKMNLSVEDIGGEVLAVSQFT
ncbi:MAG: D-tyrosyl-tRNA(Tyr) deacylase, partial [Firmicutes bacterium]|nr:D-tyrosyl-tRNA(Tyr) deacylase [Bacillota bacterium]